MLCSTLVDNNGLLFPVVYLFIMARTEEVWRVEVSAFRPVWDCTYLLLIL